MNLIVNGLITKMPVCTQDSHAGKSDQAGSVKMAGYRPGFRVFMERDVVEVCKEREKRTRLISSHLDRTSLVSK